MKVRLPLLVLALIIAVPATAAEPLGRLFFTPAQRAKLDAGKAITEPKKAAPTVQGPRSVTVNGIVTRSDGESTVWVNGAPAGTRRPNAAPITAKPAGEASARVRVMESDARLRVGQTLDRRTGRILEPYQTRRTVESGAAEVPAPDGQADGSANGDNTGAR